MSLNISYMEYSSDLKLGEGLCIIYLPLFISRIPDVIYGMVFDFDFDLL